MRTCAFCPSVNLTKEHIWGDWINGILPQPGNEFTTRRKTAADGDFEEWKTVGIIQTAKIVCADCNNGWMSNLESQHAKPTLSDMIRYGGAVSILPSGIASIAAWAFKMTVIANFVGALKAQPYFTSAERYDFAKTLKIPNGVQMWLFSLNTPGRVTGKFNSHLGRFPINVKYAFELYIATFAIGYLGIQVVGSRWDNPHLSAIMGAFPGLREPDKWDGATVPLLPSNGLPVRWPPRFNLTSNVIDEFCNRWKQLKVPTWMIDGKLAD